MRTPVATLSHFVLALSLCHAVGAQGPPPLNRGDRIRLTVPTVGADAFVVAVESATMDTIRVRTSRGVLSAFPLDRVTQLEVSRGVRRPVWSKTAPLWLTLVGLTGGFVGGYSKPASRTSRKDSGEFIAAFAGGLGLITGAFIAVAVPGTERWKTVPTPRGSRTPLMPSLYADPAARGMKVGLRATF
jgi:hypothetical protein